LIIVGQNAETEFGIFIDDMALGAVIAQMGRHEALILEDVLQEFAHLLAPRRTWFGFEKAMALGGKRFESMGHNHFSYEKTNRYPLGASVRTKRRECKTLYMQAPGALLR
jgi:hypothetical protein